MGVESGVFLLVKMIGDLYSYGSVQKSHPAGPQCDYTLHLLMMETQHAQQNIPSTYCSDTTLLFIKLDNSSLWVLL